MASKNNRGAPKGSLNAIQSGQGLRKRRLVLGKLPKRMVAVEREGQKYRLDLEALVLAAKGEITVTDAHLIDTATAATVQAGKCRWIERNCIEKMTVSDMRATAADIVKAKQQRDKAVAELKLDAPAKRAWEDPMVINQPEASNE